ncbi:MAG: hypothetical protein M3R36_09190 [Bacteroidota bacterium]|nr:hypothetical protein [Bacteroidota bacterium]
MQTSLHDKFFRTPACCRNAGRQAGVIRVPFFGVWRECKQNLEENKKCSILNVNLNFFEK